MPMGMGSTAMSTSLPPSAYVHTVPPKVSLRAGLGPVELGWARTLFCDVIVAIPERDVQGKVGYRPALGCHLGYDDKRRGHFVFCPKEQRLGTYKVLRWYEDRFEQCKGISADKPVEYHTLDDLQYGQETTNLLPKFIRRTPRADELRNIMTQMHGSHQLTGSQAHADGHSLPRWTKP